MKKNKITCTIRSKCLEVDMTPDTAMNVLYALKGFDSAYNTLAVPQEDLRNYRRCQFIAEEFLEKPELFDEFRNEKFIDDENEIPGYVMFLLKVTEKILAFI